MPLEAFKKNVIDGARKGLRRAARAVQEREKQNIGLIDHTLKDLAALGHPYAQTHPKDIHTPLPGDVQPVHIQSGKLYDAVTIWQEGENSWVVGLKDWTQPPYALSVIEGILPTKNYGGMIPRDFPAATLIEVDQEGIIYDNMEAALNEAIRKS